MADIINAIETRYRGHKFRSRLEARWCVFFDALHIKWEYEPQGYKIGLSWDEPGSEHEKRLYLPDFRLPDFNSWVEVKGDVDLLDFQLMADAVDWGRGLPDMDCSLGDNRGLILLGPIPPYWVSRDNWQPVHPILQHSKGGWLSEMYFEEGGFCICRESIAYFDSSCGLQGNDEEWVKDVRFVFDGSVGGLGAKNMPIVKAAYDTARMARFEHGEAG